MKRIFLLLLFVLAHSYASIAQTYYTDVTDGRLWQSEKLKISLSSSSLCSITRHSNYESTLYNGYDSTKEDKRNHSISYTQARLNLSKMTRTSGAILRLYIEDINNDPAHYKYGVMGDKGKEVYIRDIYWGLCINFRAKYTGNLHNANICFHTSGYNGYYNRYAICSWGETPRRGFFNDGWKEMSNWFCTPKVIQIEYKSDGSAEIYLLSGKYLTLASSYMYMYTVSSVDEIINLELLLGPAARIKVSGELYSKKEFAMYANYVDKGDAEMKSGNYIQAANYYSQAIDKGYKNYDIYMKRANAYFACEFLNNAIDDYTTAIFYEKKAEAFLMRGKAKLLKSDMSGIEDLKKGGPEGIAIAKEIEADKPSMPSSHGGTQYKASGSGFVLSQDGIIVTNYHVVEGMKSIDIFVNQNENTRKYKAKVLISDKTNDISLLKVEDSSFTGFKTLPYSVNTKTLDVGTKVFALGYPMSDVLGEEIKLTDGLISSKTGYQGDIVTYQISAPIQPGSSGGPLFDQSGNIVGITNAGIPEAENVGYAIKASYLKNLIDVAPDTIILPTHNYISGLSFTEKVKRLTPYVVLIKVY